MAISKIHEPPSGYDARFWFAFHPHQKEFLDSCNTGYIALGCGNEIIIFLFPFQTIESLLPYMWKTENEERNYKHIVIIQKDNDFILRLPYDDKNNYMNIMSYKLDVQL